MFVHSSRRNQCQVIQVIRKRVKNTDVTDIITTGIDPMNPDRHQPGSPGSIAIRISLPFHVDKSVELRDQLIKRTRRASKKQISSDGVFFH